MDRMQSDTGAVRKGTENVGTQWVRVQIRQTCFLTAYPADGACAAVCCLQPKGPDALLGVLHAVGVPQVAGGPQVFVVGEGCALDTRCAAGLPETSCVAGDALLLLWGVVGLLDVGGLRGDVWVVTRERMASDFDSARRVSHVSSRLYSSMVSDRLNK